MNWPFSGSMLNGPSVIGTAFRSRPPDWWTKLQFRRAQAGGLRRSWVSFWGEDTRVVDQAPNAKGLTIVETSWPAETHFPPAVRLKHPHRMQIACHIQIQSTEAWHKATAQTHQVPIQVTGLVRVAIPLESRVHVNDSGVVDHAPHCKGCNTVQASWERPVRCEAVGPALCVQNAALVINLQTKPL